MSEQTNHQRFEQWLIDNGKSPRTAESYAGAVNGLLSGYAIENSIVDAPLLDYEGPISIVKIAHEIRQLEPFKTKNNKGNGMYGAALKWFVSFRLELLSEQVGTDIDAVEASTELPSTERKALVAARVGQGRFRQELVKKWGCCAATGFTQTSLLVASHIKPWRLADNRERLDPYNGLLLLPNIDKAFDRNYITFAQDGKIILSRELENIQQLAVTEDIKIKFDVRHQKYLDFHRNECFRDRAK